MKREQESKFDCGDCADGEGRLFNRATGEPIPDDEPVFVLRAKDLNALTAIRAYIAAVADPQHREAVARRAEQFEDFAQRHPKRMKVPDTDWSCVHSPDNQEAKP